jgi:hypothetical protein
MMTPASLTFNLQLVATVITTVISNSFVPNVVVGARTVRRSAGIGGCVTCLVPLMEAPPNVEVPVSSSSVSVPQMGMVWVPV